LTQFKGKKKQTDGRRNFVIKLRENSHKMEEKQALEEEKKTSSLQ
jgi:hypothetical protein